MLHIRPGPIEETLVTLPGSKSYTHRALIAAALSNGWCRIGNCLDSEDTRCTMRALSVMGAQIEAQEAFFAVRGCGGSFREVTDPIDLENSGTSMRLLAALCALGEGSYILTGTERMKERPIHHLLSALEQIGVYAESVNGNGCPPVRIKGGRPEGGPVSIDCSISSQYLSALLLIAPLTVRGLDIYVERGPVSKPYIDMTIDVLARFGILLKRMAYESFSVPGGQHYDSGHYDIEPDASQAGYFWAAAAITGEKVGIRHLTPMSFQGDVRFATVLTRMGCRIEHTGEGLFVVGAPLTGIEVDMADMPDLVPTLAVVAAFAKGRTVIRNVGHLRAKESDRLAAVQKELTKMRVAARISGDDLIVEGGAPQGAVIETYNDHRMAMSFAVAGLRTPGTAISNEGCVAKSFPDFWEVFEQLYESS
jgi:3-phosphoshikimate 1-carboxyvinyltransferase